jgi:hypothetical protein
LLQGKEVPVSLGWVDAVKKRKFPWPCQQSNPGLVTGYEMYLKNVIVLFLVFYSGLGTERP